MHIHIIPSPNKKLKSTPIVLNYHKFNISEHSIQMSSKVGGLSSPIKTIEQLLEYCGYTNTYTHSIEPEHISLPDPSTVHTCIISITSHAPYDSSDSSKFTSGPNDTFCQTIGYAELGLLAREIEVCNSSKSTSGVDGENNGENTPGRTSGYIHKLISFVTSCYRLSHPTFIFRFLCSPSCCMGSKFIDDPTTNLVLNFVRGVSVRPRVLVEFSDHALGALVRSWDPEIMGIECPIRIKTYTHGGKFRMWGSKADFMSSLHPVLRRVGDMGRGKPSNQSNPSTPNTHMVSDPNLIQNGDGDVPIVLTFCNMEATQVYEITNPTVRVISFGYQISGSGEYKPNLNEGYGSGSCWASNPRTTQHTVSEVDTKHIVVPVHSEFAYINSHLIFSSTHWCNLHSVESDVDIPTLCRYCTEYLGEEATRELDKALGEITHEAEERNVISNVVRQISSGK